MKQAFIIFISAIISIACNDTKQIAVPSNERAAPGDATITDVFWSLTEVNGNPVVQAPDDKLIFIKLTSKDSKLFGNGGCNTMFGSFDLNDGKKIKITVGSTKMACEGKRMEIETAFFNALGQVDSYFIKGDTLQLFKAKMAPLAKFEAKYFPR